MSKVILISQSPLPFSGIGSWTTLYKNYLESNHKIDYIICQKTDYTFDDVEYEFVEPNFFHKISNKISNKPYAGFINALQRILKNNEEYIIQIIDNYGIIRPLEVFLSKSKFRKNCYLQFFYHGFPPFYGDSEFRFFFDTIDEMVLLTKTSYTIHKNYYTSLPCKFNFLHNGIDTSVFYSLTEKLKIATRQSKNIDAKKVFVWCSQDRPKKGLNLILCAWQAIYQSRQDIELWVIGCEPKKAMDGVVYIGKIPNNQLANYLQLADCYLFPTLCHEGFGMTLIEALHCGNYVIASNIGGIPEVLQFGKFGKLVENPNFVSEWQNAILEFLDNKPFFEPLPKQLYSKESWINGMNELIDNAKSYLKIKT